MITHEDVDARFAFHPPASERRRAEHARVRGLLRAAAHELIDLVPPGRDQELMIDHLEDAMFRGNRGLALAPDRPTGEPAEIAHYPAEVRRLLHAVDRLRDQYAEADGPRRNELWRDVHEAADVLWGLRSNSVAVEGDTRTSGVLAPAPAVGEGES